MDNTKQRNVGLRIATYNKIKELSESRFEMPVSMAQTVKFFIDKSYEDFINNKKTKENTWNKQT